jgi:hypothetical protein
VGSAGARRNPKGRFESLHVSKVNNPTESTN